MPFWQAVMVARLPQQWAKVDLMHAANLARCLADIESSRKALLKEGMVLKTAAGPKINPRHQILETLNRRALAITRVLQIHAMATIGGTQKLGAGKAEAEQAADVLAPPADTRMADMDSLLARPRLQ